MSDSIHQEIQFEASPEAIYKTLLDSEQFSEMAGGAPTDIETNVGGSFSCFGGMVVGRNVELVPNQRIVQAWRIKDWPDGVYSIAKFELKNDGEGTEMVFDHSGFPIEMKEHLEGGWHKMYWDPLKTHIG